MKNLIACLFAIGIVVDTAGSGLTIFKLAQSGGVCWRDNCAIFTPSLGLSVVNDLNTNISRVGAWVGTGGRFGGDTWTGYIALGLNMKTNGVAPGLLLGIGF